MLNRDAYSDGFAAVYDELMNDVDYDAWGRAIITKIEKAWPNRLHHEIRIMDAACGTGSISLRLADAGFDVAASDISESMLRIASEKTRLLGKHIAFSQQSLLCLRSPKPLHVLNVACDGVNYLTEEGALSQFCDNAYQILEEGGLLLFDISSDYKLCTVLDGYCQGEDLGEVVYLWQNNFEDDSSVLAMDLTLFFQQSEDCYRCERESHYQRAFYESEVITALDDAGFIAVSCDQDQTGSPTGVETMRLFFSAQKPITS